MNKYKNDNYRGIQERTLESQVLNKPKIKKRASRNKELP